jgi:hypothetical protein
MNKAKLIEDLKKIRKDATMQTANFSQLPTGEVFTYPTYETEVTAFIEERTRLWRDTWIVGMLDEVINDLERGTARYQD